MAGKQSAAKELGGLQEGGTEGSTLHCEEQVLPMMKKATIRKSQQGEQAGCVEKAK